LVSAAPPRQPRGASYHHRVPDDAALLRAENDELRRRLDTAEQELAAIRDESRRRTEELRTLVRDVPATLSRRATVAALFDDVVRHPDKAGVCAAAFRRLARAPRRAWLLVTGR
jgi:sugar-specific transcriptional regulator TrmB